jgi:hypothetical protein
MGEFGKNINGTKGSIFTEENFSDYGLKEIFLDESEKF